MGRGMLSTVLPTRAPVVRGSATTALVSIDPHCYGRATTCYSSSNIVFYPLLFGEGLSKGRINNNERPLFVLSLELTNFDFENSSENNTNVG